MMAASAPDPRVNGRRRGARVACAHRAGSVAARGPRCARGRAGARSSLRPWPGHRVARTAPRGADSSLPGLIHQNLLTDRSRGCRCLPHRVVSGDSVCGPSLACRQRTVRLLPIHTTDSEGARHVALKISERLPRTIELPHQHIHAHEIAIGAVARGHRVQGVPRERRRDHSVRRITPVCESEVDLSDPEHRAEGAVDSPSTYGIV